MNLQNSSFLNFFISSIVHSKNQSSLFSSLSNYH